MDDTQNSQVTPLPITQGNDVEGHKISPKSYTYDTQDIISRNFGVQQHNQIIYGL